MTFNQYIPLTDILNLMQCFPGDLYVTACNSILNVIFAKNLKSSVMLCFWKKSLTRKFFESSHEIFKHSTNHTDERQCKTNN